MALRDYILCSQCECKLVYDGAHDQRDWLEERFNTRSLICPTCAAEQKRRADLYPELVEFVQEFLADYQEEDGMRPLKYYAGKAFAILAKCKEQS